MKGTRRSKVWLALAAVVAASLVLAGCPHNNLLDSSGGGGAGNGGGSRGGSDGVQLVITNFVSEEGAANRSASWLGGPQKTIVPEHIDLKGNTDDYVFIASGTGGGTYGPKFVDIAPTSGIASLDISGGGIWEITVDAYAVDKVTGQGGVTGTDKATIMATPDNAEKIVGLAATAKVLTGRATVDLGSGSQVTMTLTNDGVGTQGGVNVDVYFDAQFDKEKIRDDGYKVSVSLYDFVTGEIAQAGGLSSEQEIHNGVGDIGDPEVYTVNDVDKGRYQFRLEVTDPTAGDKVVAYYVDDIYVEGNRITKKDVHIADLFKAPTPPTDLRVYWSKREDTDLKDGFLAAIRWDGVSYNAVGINIEVADISKYYSYVTNNHRVNFGTLNGNPALDLVDTSTLWDEIDRVSDVYNGVVTRLSWKDSPQEATRYPTIWRSGSLLNGSNGITFLMQTGHVYSVRISAAGAQTDSSWVYFGDLTGAATSPGGGYTEFTELKNQGLFDLVEVTYDLEGKYFLYKTGDGNAIGTKATKDDLVEYQEYNPGSAYMVDKKYANISQTPKDDWFLYPQLTTLGVAPTTVTDRIMTWTGWQNKNNPNDNYLVTNNWNATGYTGYSNLHLIPVGAGGSVTVQAETSGTFDVLDATNVLISIEASDTPTAATATWAELQNGDTNPVPGAGGADPKNTGLALAADATRYILNLKRGGATPTVLYVAVGDDPTPDKIGILTSRNSSEFTVNDIQVSLKQGLTERVTFNVKPTEPVAYYQMDGVASGDYTLLVKILTDSGYWQTYQVPFVVKYDDQVIP